MADIARDLLRGAVDLHIHTGPDLFPRIMDDVQLAESARDAGMAAIVLKTHYMMTADRAQVAQRLCPGVQVFGGFALNWPTCGGLNVDAVKVALRMGVKVIWLPTTSASNHIEGVKRRDTGYLGFGLKGFSRTPVHVLDENGAVKPELKEILGLMAEADIILATGHVSVPEQKAVIDAALAAGVRKILVTHPELWLIGMSVEDQRELAAKGVLFERCVRSVTAQGQDDMSPQVIADQIKAVGAEYTVMSTDYGQKEEPPPAQGMHRYIQWMMECGISAEEIELMVRVNPSRLLGI